MNDDDPSFGANLQPVLKSELVAVNYGISRTSDKRRGTWGWSVCLRRNGRRMGIRYFYDHHYVDGTQGSLQAARAYRDILLRQYPPISSAEFRKRLQPANTSGVSGVCRDSGKTEYWIATTQLRDGTNLVKRFSVKRFGEGEAKQMAIAERSLQLQQVNHFKLARASLGHRGIPNTCERTLQEAIPTQRN